MNAVGYGVRLLDKERCCGVAKIANKCIDEAIRDSNNNIRAISEAVEQGDECLPRHLHAASRSGMSMSISFILTTRG